ncbi:hypothetical protein BJ878DRAFT_552116 [Calycina marina]|uniref:Uncharacterized protein n=1 Tax=Calycina marina TaxID=1763456 RepID=A0A9P8CFU5_9HELO|nr:hypothetical protein BJ878DRAFT_552116 [Calycina marina]
MGVVEAIPSCVRIKHASEMGEIVDWLQLQRRLGIDAGLTMEGQGFAVLRGNLQEILSPHNFSGFLLLTTVAFYGFFYFTHLLHDSITNLEYTITNLAEQAEIYLDADEDIHSQPEWSLVTAIFLSTQLVRKHQQLQDDFTKLKLKAQLSYAGTSRLDRLQLKDRLDETQTKLENNEERLVLYRQERDLYILSLATERNVIRYPCDDVKRCDAEKRAMREYGLKVEEKLRDNFEQVRKRRMSLGEQDRSAITSNLLLVQTVN